jgi:hypothetical protein
VGKSRAARKLLRKTKGSTMKVVAKLLGDKLTVSFDKNAGHKNKI